MNLEIRCSLKNPIPTLHFSEVLSLAMGELHTDAWFSRHLVDPRPILRERGFNL
jgi:heterodisulfide reductase subunit B